MKNLISMRELNRDEILDIIRIIGKIERDEIKPNMERKIAALLFFEPSTRTHLSFDTAMKRMGGQTITMQGTKTSSVKKGESFADTLMTISQYADIIVIRTAIEGGARFAAETVDIPVVNDGANQHPSQALLDLYSIMKTQKTLDNLSIGVVGDLKFGRTVHSLVHSLSDFSPKFYFSSPHHLKMPDYILEDLKAKDVYYEENDNVEKNIDKLDIMYVTRIQKERFADPEDYQKVKDSYIIDKKLIKGHNLRNNFRIMHPLPRVNEINTDVDRTKYAYYFQQAKNGVYTREAIISILLGGLE